MPKTGVPLSYQRFLGDSASGIVLLIFIMGALYFKMPLLGYVTGIDINQISENFLLGFSVLAVLLVSPLGLLINSLSYIVLGRFEKAAVNFFLTRRKFGIQNALENAFFHKWGDFYDIAEKGAGGKPIGWYGFFEIINVMIGIYFKALGETRSHLLGIAQFARSLALIAFFILFNLYYNFFFSDAGSHLIFLTACLAGFIFLCLYIVGFLASFATMKIFSAVYLMIQTGFNRSFKKRLSSDEVVRLLKELYQADNERKL